MKKILLIGSSGFIGRNLYDYLISKTNKYEIYAPSSNNLDVTDENKVEEYLKQTYFDVVIHCAVYNGNKDNCNNLDDKMLENSLRMFYSFEKNQQLFGKMLYFGSGAEYDKRYDIKSVKEDELDKTIPNSQYGFAKYIINKAIYNSDNIYNLRVFGLYGKYEHWKSKFISNACCKAIKNIDISIRQNVYFDYLYIDDFCEIVEYFINNKVKHKDYNIVSGKRIDLLTIAKKVVELSNKNLSIHTCIAGLGKEYTASNERLINEIENYKFTDIDVGIKNIYDWYCENENEIDIYSLLYQ